MGQGFTALIVRFKSLGKRGRKKGQGISPNYQIRQRRAQSEWSHGATVVTTVHCIVLLTPTNAGISKNASNRACAHHSSLTSDFNVVSDISGVSVSSRACIAIILPRLHRRVRFGVVRIAAVSLDRRQRPSSFGISIIWANGRPCITTSRGWTSSYRRRVPLLFSSS